MAKNGNNGDDNASESYDGTGVLKKIYQRYNNDPSFSPRRPPRAGADGVTTDKTDLFSNNFFLGFYHVASKNSVRFMAFLTDYNETYDVQTTPTDVYGRADPRHATTDSRDAWGLYSAYYHQLHGARYCAHQRTHACIAGRGNTYWIW